ncbi:MAG: UDP-N-acetylglucosamine--N-acetylmuramyl-(pentapeptide) pyrophosphoryl-undecaprenol N-acetylglucosamine transferase [Pseudomonadota bacterium]
MTDKPLLILAAGGTGGHMFPAQALSEEMLKRGWRVKLSTDARGHRYTGGFSHAVQVDVIEAATFAQGGKLAKLRVPLKILRGITQARSGLRADPPAIVVGFGGYPSLPAMLAAGLVGVPRLLHEQNGIMGRVNTFLAKRIGHVACGTWPTDLPLGVRGINIGNPIRQQVFDKVGTPYRSPQTGPLEMLVIGGSQGARILAERVPQAIALLPKAIRSRLRVAQQARDEDAETCGSIYETSGVKYVVSPFFNDVPERMARANLVISRSGASSMADISAIGRPSILIPYAAAAGNHQYANAKGLYEAGGAHLIVERKLTPQRLAARIEEILGNPTRAKKMAAIAAQYGRPNAATDLADLVEKLAEGAH